jgi:hypothetical protein
MGSRGFAVPEEPYINCRWCGAKMTMVWVNHAIVVKGDVIAGPHGRRRPNDGTLADGLYVECAECGGVGAFELRSRNDPRGVDE